MSKDYSYTKYVNEGYVNDLAEKIQQIYVDFDKESFVKQVLAKLQKLTFTNRMRHISDILRKTLPSRYPKALKILLQTLGPELTKETGTFNDGFIYWPISCFIEDYGLGHFEESMQGMYELTKRFTAEYAIRPFLIQDLRKTIENLSQWLEDPNPDVRRFICEGTRPTIPWGKKIPQLIDNPSPVIPLLESLKEDPSKYVQKSVANHLNAISKSHPDLVIQITKSWAKIKNKDTHWIIKQALRTLVKSEQTNAKDVISMISP
ncbi:MAG: DNA alkylation repair protein [Candidatus Heimdallarchaeota archaeon]